MILLNIQRCSFIHEMCFYIIEICNWLVVEPPLWKIWKSVGVTIPNIWNNKIHVPNHQPGNLCWKKSLPTSFQCKFASQLNSLDMFPSSWHRHETPADGVRNTICIADFVLLPNTGDQSSTIILSVFGQDSMDSGKNPECTPPCLEAKGFVETKAALAEAALTGLWQVAVLVLLGNQVFSDFFANSQGLCGILGLKHLENSAAIPSRPPLRVRIFQRLNLSWFEKTVDLS